MILFNFNLDLFLMFFFSILLYGIDTYHLNINELYLETHVRGQPHPTVEWFKDSVSVVNIIVNVYLFRYFNTLIKYVIFIIIIRTAI